MASGKRRRRKPASPVLLAAGVVGILLLAFLVVWAWNKYSMGTDYADLYEYYSLTAGQVDVYVDMDHVSERGIVKDGEIYLPLESVLKNVDSRYYYDSDSMIRYVLPEEIVKVSPGASSFKMQGSTVSLQHPAFTVGESGVYLSLEFMKKLSRISCEAFEDPSRLYIFTDFATEYTKTQSRANTQVRILAGIKSLILTDLPNGAEVQVLGEEGKWKKVYYNGCIGYVQTKRLGNDAPFVREAPFDAWEYPGISLDKPVRLVWHQVGLISDNEAVWGDDGLLADVKEVTVISPTWFSITDGKGNFTSKAQRFYVEEAHKRGIQVWVLLDDFDPGFDLYEVLSVNENRDNLISKIIRALKEINADGINIDFEYVYEKTGVHFVEFLRELSLVCHENNLIVSVDNYVPVGGRDWVNRKEQGVFVDYYMVMSYDEHYRGSSSAGSVASYNWSKNGIVDTLEDGVPKEKLVNGIPFYTRVWTETPESKAEAGATIFADPNSIYGRYALSSYSAGMEEASSLLYLNKAKKVWLEEERQYYGQYEKNGSTVRIWLEDQTSLKEKLNLINEYDIAGAAFWRLGYEDVAVWRIIGETIQ